MEIISSIEIPISLGPMKGEGEKINSEPESKISLEKNGRESRQVRARKDAVAVRVPGVFHGPASSGVPGSFYKCWISGPIPDLPI